MHPWVVLQLYRQLSPHLTPYFPQKTINQLCYYFECHQHSQQMRCQDCRIWFLQLMLIWVSAPNNKFLSLRPHPNYLESIVCTPHCKFRLCHALECWNEKSQSNNRTSHPNDLLCDSNNSWWHKTRNSCTHLKVWVIVNEHHDSTFWVVQQILMFIHFKVIVFDSECCN